MNIKHDESKIIVSNWFIKKSSLLLSFADFKHLGFFFPLNKLIGRSGKKNWEDYVYCGSQLFIPKNINSSREEKTTFFDI